MARCLLIRHGATAWTVAGRFQGQTDVPLSPHGQHQVAMLAQRLQTETFDALYASDLQRAWETARAVAAPHMLALHAEPRLREIAFGRWEGFTYKELQDREPEGLQAWERDPMHVAPPGGETLGQLTERVQTVYTALQTMAQNQTIILVAHGGPLQVLLCLALGLQPHLYWQFAMAPASISELGIYARGAILTRLNDTHHLTHGRTP